MNKKQEKEAILNSYLKLVEFLAKLYGPTCEIVLHAVENDKASIVAIENRDIDNRQVGEDIDEVGSKIKELYKNKNFIVNNFERTANGKEMKSNTFFIKDSSDELIGILCINFDMTIPIGARKYLEQLTSGFNTSQNESNKKGNETTQSIKEFTLKIINDVIESSGIPVERMTPEERVNILKILKEKGVFRIKGAVREVAKHLMTSEASIYRYLKELE